MTEGETTVGPQGAATYTVALTSEPTGTVTVYADAPAGSDLRVASSGTPALTASLTFTTTDWETAQTITVTGVDDADSADDTGLAISHRVAGADYEGLTVDDTVAVTIDDDDEPGIVVAGLDEVTEGGDVELSIQAQHPAHGRCHGDADGAGLGLSAELSMGSLPLTFTTGNWSTVQTVTVTALDDDDALPLPPLTTDFTIGFAASGADYAGVTESFALTVTEDDTEELVVEPWRSSSWRGGRRDHGEARVRARGSGDGAGDARRGRRPQRDGEPGDPAVQQLELADGEDLHGGRRRGRGLRQRRSDGDLRGRRRQLRRAGRAGRGDGRRQRRSLDEGDAHRLADRTSRRTRARRR